MLGLKRAVLLASLAIVISAAVALAQEFPTKPIELVIPYAAGGSHDLTARALTSVAHQYIGQPMLVVLKPGGGGAVGSQAAIRAKPDGYTLMLGGSGPNTILPLREKIPIGPDQFAAIARINYSPAVFAVRTEAPWKTFREVVDTMKKNPGKFNFANTGPWGAGDFPMRMVLYTAQLLPQIGAGKMRALAVTDTRRHRDLPNVPTLREEGVDVVFTQWRSVLAPKGIPQAIAQKLEAAFKQMTEDSSFQALIKQLGDEIHFQAGKEFENTWRQEWEGFAKVVAGAQK